MFSRPFSFLPFGICYLSPKPPFCKGGFWSGKRGLHERPQDAPCQGVRGCKYSSRKMPANAGSWLVFRSGARRIAESYPFFCAFRGRVRDHIDNPSKPPFKFTSLLFVATARKNKFICSSLALIATLIREASLIGQN